MPPKFNLRASAVVSSRERKEGEREIPRRRKAREKKGDSFHPAGVIRSLLLTSPFDDCLALDAIDGDR